MVDIAKCSRRDCGKRMSCFRYLADSDEYCQSYILVQDIDVEDGCENYWKVSNGKELAYYNKVNR